jgi:hypothetical protein
MEVASKSLVSQGGGVKSNSRSFIGRQVYAVGVTQARFRWRHRFPEREQGTVATRRRVTHG